MPRGQCAGRPQETVRFSRGVGKEFSYGWRTVGNKNGTISNYVWDFGESYGYGKVAEHRFFEVGEFTVILSVTDDQGDTSIDILTVTIDNVPPEITYCLPSEPEVEVGYGEGIEFTVFASTVDSAGLEYSWYVNDRLAWLGSVYQFDTGRHGEGTFAVRCVVADDWDSTEQSWVVTVVPEVEEGPTDEPVEEEPAPPGPDNTSLIYLALYAALLAMVAVWLRRR